MSWDWNLTCLIEPDSLSATRLEHLVALARVAGLELLTAADRSVVATSGDGMSSLLFGSASSAIDWLSREDGLVSFVGNDEGDEMSLSVRRRSGQLQLTMATLPDVPLFDEVSLSVRSWSSNDHCAAWRFVKTRYAAVASTLGSLFVWCCDDMTVEAQWEYFCVHRRIVDERLPPFMGWLVGVPADSVIAGAIDSAASALKWTTSAEDGYLFALLGHDPAAVTQTEILAASAALRKLTGDTGCLS